MFIFMLLVLILWGFLSLLAYKLIFSAFKHVDQSDLSEIEKDRIKRSNEILEAHPKIMEIVREIVLLERHSDNEAYKMRARILRAKLKISVSNPVIRRYLFDAVSNKKNN